MFLSEFLIFSFATGSAVPPPEVLCSKPHEYYPPCGRTACNDPTCENPNDDMVCTADCKYTNFGCVCEQGYYRDAAGDCVEKSQC